MGTAGLADQGNQNQQVDREWLVTSHSYIRAMIQLRALLVKDPLKPLSIGRDFKIALQSTHRPTRSGDAPALCLLRGCSELQGLCCEGWQSPCVSASLFYALKANICSIFQLLLKIWVKIYNRETVLRQLFHLTGML